MAISNNYLIKYRIRAIPACRITTHIILPQVTRYNKPQLTERADKYHYIVNFSDSPARYVSPSFFSYIIGI